MKKFALGTVLSIGIVGLSACSLTKNSSKEKVELSFDNAYKTYITTQLKDSEKNIKDMLAQMKGEWKSHSMIAIETKDTTTGTVLEILNSSEQNQDTLTLSGDAKINVKIFANGEEYKLDTSLAVFKSLSGDKLQQYLKIGKLDLFLGSGNVQAGMIQAMAQPVVGNWIKLDMLNKKQAEQKNIFEKVDSVSEVKKIFANIVELPKIMREGVILENLGKGEFEKKLAYNVKVKSDAIKKIIKSLVKGTSFASGLNLSGVDTMDIKGLLIVNDTDDVNLLLNDFNGEKSSKILFTEEKLTFTHVFEGGEQIEINFEKKNKGESELNFVVHVPEAGVNKQFDIKGEFDIKRDIEENKREYVIKGEIKASGENLNEILGRDTLILRIEIEGEDTKVENIIFETPKSAMLMSELLSNFGPMMGNHQMPGLSGNNKIVK